MPHFIGFFSFFSFLVSMLENIVHVEMKTITIVSKISTAEHPGKKYEIIFIPTCIYDTY